jgi:hypothetical protein
VLPMGPVKQWTDAPSDEPTTLVVYPGADGASSLYDDDGHTFAYRRGAWTRLALTWRDGARRLAIRLAPGARMLGAERRFAVRVAGSDAAREIVFRGTPLEIRL